MNVDPFTLVHQKLWEIIGTHFDTFTPAIVGTNNRIDMTEEGFVAFKDNANSTADAPELVIVQSIFSFGPQNSKSFGLPQSYDLMITAETLEVTKINRVKWEVIRALTPKPFLDLEPFVKGWTVTSGSDDPFGPERWTRGARRWTSVARVNVDISVSSLVA